jgi:hypothetical protein
MYLSYGSAGALFNLGAWYNSQSADYNQPFTISAASLGTGAYLDRPAVGPGGYWNATNPDPHAWGYSFDVYSPSSSVTKANFVNAVKLYCDRPPSGTSIYDFYNQEPASQTELTNTTTYLWHIYCPTGGLGGAVYPN